MKSQRYFEKIQQFQFQNEKRKIHGRGTLLLKVLVLEVQIHGSEGLLRNAVVDLVESEAQRRWRSLDSDAQSSASESRRAGSRV